MQCIHTGMPVSVALLISGLLDSPAVVLQFADLQLLCFDLETQYNSFSPKHCPFERVVSSRLSFLILPIWESGQPSPQCFLFWPAEGFPAIGRLPYR